MSLREALESIEGERGNRCATMQRLNGMTSEDRAVFDATVTALRKQRGEGAATCNQFTPMTCTSLHRALTATGYSVSKDGLQKHVFGHCRCERP